jgi:hypothetical protein
MQASLGDSTTVGTITDTFGNLSLYMPLALGAVFFASDTKQLLFGTPGVGIGYIQIGDARVNETLLALLREIKAIRFAMVSLACQGNLYTEMDFSPEQLASDPQVNETL